MSEPADTPFRVYRLSEGGGAVTRAQLDDLAGGDVVIRAAYSSVNYKDALAGTGRGRIARRLPLVGGIDVAGTVVSSGTDAIGVGHAVLVTGCGLSEDHDGGFAEYVRVPGDWVIPLPDGLDLFEAMALGTAGFTAGLALMRLEENGVEPAHGPIAVTGASGGVGSLAVDLLAARGYEVDAVSGKSDAADFLTGLGASRVIDPGELGTRGRPLERAHWGGAIDNVGAHVLADLLRTTVPWGSVASIGLAAGTDLATSVMPFILRGVSLIGITSANCPMDRRRAVWQRLADDWKPPHLHDIVAATVDMDELDTVFEQMLAGASRGRTVVRIGAA